LRDTYEPTPRWNDYLTWVRSKHPSGVMLKDPSPRKSETEKASQSIVPVLTPPVIATPTVIATPQLQVATPQLQVASEHVTEEIVEDVNDLGDL